MANVSSEASPTRSFQLLEFFVFMVLHQGRGALASPRRPLVRSGHHIMDRQLAIPHILVALLFGAAIEFGTALWTQQILIVRAIALEMLPGMMRQALASRQLEIGLGGERQVALALGAIVRVQKGRSLIQWIKLTLCQRELGLGCRVPERIAHGVRAMVPLLGRRGCLI